MELDKTECKFLEEVKKLIKVIFGNGTTINLSDKRIINAIINASEQILSQHLPYNYKNQTKAEIQAQIKDRIKNSLKFMKQLQEQFLNKLIKTIVLKVIAMQFIISKTASYHTDTAYIDKNILLQTTYYKTLTKRP